MKDDIAKQKGLPFSTSRKQERAAKHNTHKARRQDGRKACELDRFTNFRYDSDGFAEANQ